jgi:steroid 5-alpha reductase family enzyme
MTINQSAEKECRRLSHTKRVVCSGFISCPNHFGEIIEWIGFAVIAWNLPALSFAVDMR